MKKSIKEWVRIYQEEHPPFDSSIERWYIVKYHLSINAMLRNAEYRMWFGTEQPLPEYEKEEAYQIIEEGVSQYKKYGGAELNKPDELTMLAEKAMPGLVNYINRTSPINA